MKRNVWRRGKRRRCERLEERENGEGSHFRENLKKVAMKVCF